MSKYLKRLYLAGLAAIIGTGLLTGCSSDGENATELTVYSGRSQEYVETVYERFQEESGIKLNIRYADSAELAAQLLEEGANSPADVFVSQDAGSLGAVADSGLLAKLPPEVMATVPSRFSSRENLWVGITGRARVFAYDPKTDLPLPQSYSDFTKPIYKGSFGIAPTNGSFQAFVTALRISIGDEATETWLRGVVANAPKMYEKNSMIVEAIEAGEIDFGLVNHYYVYEVSQSLGRKIDVVNGFFADGDLGNLINVSGAGVLANSKKSKAARQLVEFLLRESSQETFVSEIHEFPLLPGVKGPDDQPELEEIAAPLVDLNSLRDLKGTQRLLIKVGLL
jgi:iron(III) transport system substrate-binding protein